MNGMKPDMIDNPRVGWLSGRLSHKALISIIAFAAVCGVLMCCIYLWYIGAYADSTYRRMAEESESGADAAAQVLADSGGDFSALQQYAEQQNISCEVRGSDGNLLFSYRPAQETEGFLASGSTGARLKDGSVLEVRTWSAPLKVNEIESSLRRSALTGLIVMIVCVFVGLSVLQYLFVIGPVVNLRRTVREYYEHGTQPKRSARQDEIGRLQNAFADMTGALEKKEQTERRLVASISHDLKTPLTSVMGYSERLLSADLPQQKQRQYLQNIYDKALAIKGLVDEFDDYLDAGIHENAPTELMTMGDFCEAVRREYQTELADAGVKFTVECRCPDAKIQCSFARMRRFFGNLIGNSIQHAGAEHLELSLVCGLSGDRVVLLFRDNGCGVPPELLGQIFEPFFTTDRGRKVSGLGLTICESVIRAHRGTLTAENAPGGGLCIRAELPAAEEAAGKEREKKA